MSSPPQHSNRAKAIWLACLASAARTALACTIVGIATLYGPTYLKHYVKFPAFSYLTVVLISTDATLGDTLHGCWLALYASVLSLAPAMLSLWLIGPAKLTLLTTALAVALGGFVVVLPESTHLLSKRIALGQIVLVYVVGFINGGKTQPIMHPLHVAVSTMVGVMACVFALLLPYPRMACCEAKKNCKSLAENATERLKLLVNAVRTEDDAAASASISKAKLLTVAGTKLLQSIKRFQGSITWEKIPFKFLRPYYMNSGEKLQDIEIALRGMEIAFESNSSFPGRMLKEELKESLQKMEEHISLNIKQTKKSDSLSIPESNADDISKFLQTIETIPPTHNNLPTFFFLFCMKLLHDKSLPKPTTKNTVLKDGGASEYELSFKEVWISCGIKKNSIVPAFKFSVALGLSVLFGLMYSKPSGFWSGLAVAVSYAAAREATFRVANVKIQGTVLGAVYGVIGYFIFEKFLSIRFLSLLPWFLFTSFLRQSKMYGQAGGICAIIGAVLILGRKDFGSPTDFAIARIVENFIGLSCLIVVELVFQPTRASTFAKIELSKSLDTLHECVGSMSLYQADLVENQKKFKSKVKQVGKYIGEAEEEPNFWFLPFHSACYGKLLGCLSKIVHLLLFGALAIEFLEHESQKLKTSWKEPLNKLDCDLKLYRESVGSLIKHLADISIIKSLPILDKELEKNNISFDIETGKSTSPNCFRVYGDSDEDEMDKILDSFLQHSKEVIDAIHGIEGEKEFKGQMGLSLSALGCCMKSIIKEARQIEEGIRELVQWENPSSHVNLHEISCKIRALYG